MITTRTLALLAGLLLVTACGSSDRSGSSGTNSRPSVALDDICEIFDARPHWQRATGQARSKWGTPVEVQMAIIWHESKFQSHARNPSSSAYGFPQAINSTWDWYRSTSGNRSGTRSDFSDSTDFVGWYTNRTLSSAGVPLGNAYHQYLAYHEGHTGYKRGNYRNKSSLLKVAAQVQSMADRYERQLQYCG